MKNDFLQDSVVNVHESSTTTTRRKKLPRKRRVRKKRARAHKVPLLVKIQVILLIKGTKKVKILLLSLVPKTFQELPAVKKT